MLGPGSLAASHSCRSVLQHTGSYEVHLLLHVAIGFRLVRSKMPIVASARLQVWKLELPCSTAPFIEPQSGSS
jgi:hypothetical protein